VQAIQIDRYGGPEVLSRRELAVPAPRPGEALVRLTHSGINFMDIHTRQGLFEASRTYPIRLPVTLGIEGAGVVEALGEGVSTVRVGERVAYCISWGSFAEYAVVPAWRLAPLPDGIANETAAALMFNGCTAHYLAADVGRLGPGTTCLVLAASGGVGQLLIQLAKHRGARGLAATSTEEKAAAARRRGADATFLYEEGGFAERARDATGGRGADVVFDPIGAATLRASMRATRRKGLVVNFGYISGSLRDLDPIELGEAGSLYLTRPRLADHGEDGDAVRRRAGELFSAVQAGALQVDIGRRCSLDDVPAALAAIEERRQIGKPLLVLP
jgi:NADPH2:quinone reductase